MTQPVAPYLRPGDLAQALAALSGGTLRIVAGCTDVLAATEAQTLPHGTLDLTGVSALRGITQTPDGWRIGAVTPWSDIARATLPPAFASLQSAALQIGAVQVQNAGTIGGKLCNASPAADGVPPLLTLDAAVELASHRGSRTLPLHHFLLGPRQTARAPDEILTAVLIPSASTTGHSAFLKLGSRAALVISIAMVAARLTLTPHGKVTGAAIAIGACGPTAQRLPLLEAWLTQHHRLPDHLAPFLRLAPITDIRADAAYRLEAAAILIRRTLITLLERRHEPA